MTAKVTGRIFTANQHVLWNL